MTTYHRDHLSGDLKATRYAPEQWERQTLEVDGVKITADVVPFDGGVTYNPFVYGRMAPSKSFCFQQTNFPGWEKDVLEVEHPVYGKIDKTMIGLPFNTTAKKVVNDRYSKRFKWKIHSFDCNGLVLEKTLPRGLFQRKIYKFIK